MSESKDEYYKRIGKQIKVALMGDGLLDLSKLNGKPVDNQVFEFTAEIRLDKCVIEFGKSIKWFGFTKDQTIAFIQQLISLLDKFPQEKPLVAKIKVVEDKLEITNEIKVRVHISEMIMEVKEGAGLVATINKTAETIDKMYSNG